MGFAVSQDYRRKGLRNILLLTKHCCRLVRVDWKDINGQEKSQEFSKGHLFLSSKSSLRLIICLLSLGGVRKGGKVG